LVVPLGDGNIKDWAARAVSGLKNPASLGYIACVDKDQILSVLDVNPGKFGLHRPIFARSCSNCPLSLKLYVEPARQRFASN
jgi:hypothetical protein